MSRRVIDFFVEVVVVLAVVGVGVGSACTFDSAGLDGSGDDSPDDTPGEPATDAAAPRDAGHVGADAPPNADPDPDASDFCDTRQPNLPFVPTNFEGTAVPAPLACEELAVPEGETWIIDTSPDTPDDERLIVTGTEEPERSAVPGTFEVFAPAQGPEVARVVVEDAELEDGATLRARGERPLSLVSLADIAVGDGARITVRPDGSGAPSAGADDALCQADEEAGFGGVGESDSGCTTGGQRGGGGGGGFGAPGGSGGGPPEGGSAGHPSGAVHEFLRGGCRGGEGVGAGAESAGPAGGGIQLVAAERIEVGDGSAVTASGGGGGGGSPRRGGGGGGSGGAVFVEAPSIDVEGALTASGGGGGEGGGTVGSIGDPGSPGSSDGTDRASGGSSSSSGGAGGSGGAREDEEGADGDDGRCTGGGGGGGAGVILLRACEGEIAEIDAEGISPAPTTVGDLDCEP